MCVGWSTTPQYISRTSHGAPRLPSAARRGPSAGAAKCEGRLWTCPRTRPTRTVPGRAAPPTSRPLPSLFPLSYLFSTAAGRPGLETPSTCFRLEPEATGTVDTRGQALPSCRGGAGSVGRGQPAEDSSAREGESQRILPPPHALGGELQQTPRAQLPGSCYSGRARSAGSAPPQLPQPQPPASAPRPAASPEPRLPSRPSPSARGSCPRADRRQAEPPPPLAHGLVPARPRRPRGP